MENEDELFSKLKNGIKEIPVEECKLKNIHSVNSLDKDTFLTSNEYDFDMGYERLKDGSVQVSMYCLMEGVDEQMLEWWFWWHPKNSSRYQIWFPNAHFAISYANKDRNYFDKETYPGFKENTQYPKEKIGKSTNTLRIRFLTPEHFGFSKEAISSSSAKTIICGKVGIKGFLDHTEMAHIYKEYDGKRILVSRFWMGSLLKKPLRKPIITDELAKAMAEHCYLEYRNLARILPILYKEYSQSGK